ncbi:MAG TPA: ABC transporter permease [Acidothermaceae bacterium]
MSNAVALLAAIGISIAFALRLCWISVFVGMIARTAGAVQGIMFLLVLPLSFGSHVFVTTSTVPGRLQAFIKVNPLSHLVGTVRGLVIGAPVTDHLLWTFTRARYDADATIAAFSAGLRDAVDLERVQLELLEAVHRSLRPAGASVWIRAGSAGPVDKVVSDH